MAKIVDCNILRCREMGLNVRGIRGYETCISLIRKYKQDVKVLKNLANSITEWTSEVPIKSRSEKKTNPCRSFNIYFNRHILLQHLLLGWNVPGIKPF
jgi:hypothetical protein